MWWLLALALHHPSLHDFLSASDAPAQAVYESYADSLFAAPANDNNINISIKAHNTHPEVNSKHFDYIDTNYMTSPVWLTSNPFTPQAKRVLAQHGVKRKLPTMMISYFWKNSTGAATGGRHPVEGDSASANVAATTEPTSSSSRELVPYFVSDTTFGAPSPCSSPSTSPRAPRGPAPAAPRPGNPKPEPKPKKPGNQKPLNEYGYMGIIISFYDMLACELACYFALGVNEHNNNFGKPGTSGGWRVYRRRKEREKAREKKREKFHPLRAHFRRQNAPRNLTCTTRSARSYAHAKATELKMTWADKPFELELAEIPKFIVYSLIVLSPSVVLGAGISCLGAEGVHMTIMGTVGLFMGAIGFSYFAVAIVVAVLTALNFLVRLAHTLTSPPYVWYTEALLLAVVFASLVPDARCGFATVCHNLSELAWPYLADLPTFVWPELPFLGGTRERFRAICCTAILGYVFCDVNRKWVATRAKLLLVLVIAFLFDVVALLFRVVAIATMWALNVQRGRRVACLLFFLAFVQEVMGAGDESSGRSKPPIFSGERVDYTKWFIAFTIWLALHASECTDLLEGLDDEPPPPGPPIGEGAAEAETSAAAAALHTAWQKRNRKLFGALGTAMPEWLATSLYTSKRNDGVGALAYLKGHFDAQAGSGNDRASSMQRLQASYIDRKNDLSENDVRHQYDNMMIAVNDIVTAGGARPDELLLIAMFENSLPMSYSTIKQMTRRVDHQTLLLYYNDLLGQTRAELGSRAPAIHAFSALGAPPGTTENPLAAMGLTRPPPPVVADGGRGGGRGGRGGRNGGRGGGRGGPQPGTGWQYPANPCLRCGEEGHSRTACTKPVTQCRFCGADHLGAYCSKNPTAGAKRRAISQGARDIVAREAGTATGAAALDATATQTKTSPATAPPLDEAQAHAAATAASSVHSDPALAANSYAYTMRVLGYSMCATFQQGAAACGTALSSHVSDPIIPVATSPIGSQLVTAMVDSMATYFVVNKPEYIVRVTNNNPGFTVLTAAGVQPILAVGDAHIWIPDGQGEWNCYEVPNVLLMPACSSVLYSVRVMRDLFGFEHNFDKGGAITMPNRKSTLPIRDDGSAFAIPIAFSTSAQPDLIRSSIGHPAALLTSTGSAFPADTVGTPQSLLYQRLGFPYAQAWRFVGASTTGHNLPPNVVMSTTLPVREAVMRGRARALPFLSKHPTDRTPPPPGAVIYMDFAGPVMPSFPNGFTTYCGAICAGSIYGRVVAAHTMTREVASATLALFMADISAKMKSSVPIKPYVVNCDNGSAFISQHFREFLADRQIQLRFSPPYTPQLNSQIEAMWGTTFGTARVLLAAANLPPSMHPFAMQCARWIENRLPKPSRGNQSPVYMLSKTLSDLSHLYTFGCLCLVTLPGPLRSGDKHFMDRGAPGIYLGPSEEGQCHMVYVFALRRVLPVAKLRVWEDEFPGLRGDKYRWFPDDPVAGPEHHVVQQSGSNITLLRILVVVAVVVVVSPPTRACRRRRRPAQRRRAARRRDSPSRASQR